MTKNTVYESLNTTDINIRLKNINKKVKGFDTG